MDTIIIYSIPCAHSQRHFEVYGLDGMASFEFRIVENRVVLYDSRNRLYGSATVALRDALNIGLDWEDDIISKQLESRSKR